MPPPFFHPKSSPMRVIGSFNAISEELRKQIVPLGPNDMIEYQLLEKVTIQDPATGRRETRHPHRQMYAKDTIFDPYLNDGAGGMVDIGVPAAAGIDVKNSTVNLCEKFEFERPRDGILALSGRVAFHRELHEYFQICNFLQEGLIGENRDSAHPILFRMIDNKKEARKKTSELKIKRDVFVFVSNMTLEEMRDFAASMNWDEYKSDAEILEAKIGQFSDEFPKAFNDEIQSPLFKKKAIIKRALGTIISYDPTNHSMKWANGGGVIASMERRTGENEVTAFAKWLSTAGNGEKILAQLSKKKQPAPAEME